MQLKLVCSGDDDHAIADTVKLIRVMHKVFIPDSVAFAITNEAERCAESDGKRRGSLKRMVNG